MSMLANCMRVESEHASSLIEPIEASVQDLKNGKWCCSEAHGQPGTISNVKMSKTGKHGHAKFTFNIFYPFTGQTSQEMWPGHTHLSRPQMCKNEFVVIDYDEGDGTVTCMDDKGETSYAFIAADYVDRNGNNVGDNFVELWNEAPDNGQEVWVSILEGPVHDKKKGDYLIRQVEKFQAKDMD